MKIAAVLPDDIFVDEGLPTRLSELKIVFKVCVKIAVAS